MTGEVGVMVAVMVVVIKEAWEVVMTGGWGIAWRSRSASEYSI